MPSKSVQSVLREMSFERKLVLIGAVLLVVSAFLPWYQDRDSFNTGDMYLGITGPLSLLGLTLLVLGGLNIAALVMEGSGRKLPLLSAKNSSVYLFSGIASFYLLLLATSVYFHQKFGLNITMKESQFGMFFSFIAAAFLTVGGYLAGRDRATALQQFQEDTAVAAHESSVVAAAPDDRQRPKGNLRKGSESEVKESIPASTPGALIGTSPSAGAERAEKIQKNQPSFEEFKRMVGVGRDMDTPSATPNTTSENSEKNTADDTSIHVSRSDGSDSDEAPQPFRTDL